MSRTIKISLDFEPHRLTAVHQARGDFVNSMNTLCKVCVTPKVPCPLAISHRLPSLKRAAHLRVYSTVH